MQPARDLQVPPVAPSPPPRSVAVRAAVCGSASVEHFVQCHESRFSAVVLF